MNFKINTVKKKYPLLVLLALCLSLTSLAGSKFSEARFYQVTGSCNLGSTNQQILWGQFNGTTTTFAGGWGISSLSFTMANTDNANVTKAKIWYNTINDFASAVVKDSISNPSGTISFAINGVDNLQLVSVFFFLTYDIAATGCNGSILDATIPTNGITVIGNVAGLKSPISGSNPSGNRSILTSAFSPSVSVTTSSSSVLPGQSVTLTPNPTNGGTNPSYAWYVNGVYTATTSGIYVINSITATTTAYCIMTSNLSCVSPTTATSATKTINVQGYKYSASTFYQISGAVSLGAKNQQIVYAKLDGATTTSSGGWGVSSLSFTTNNTDNANVTKAKLWYNTTNDFATAIVKDSISNPSGTITFSISGVSNLELNSVYFFLTYDVAAAGCNNNVLDASVPTNAITITGNIAGQKSATSTSLSGNRTISTTSFTPAVSVTSSSSSVTPGGSVTFTPTPTNGGTSPSYAWYVNGAFASTTTGTFVLSNITAATAVYCIMTSNLPCVSPLTATSATKNVSIGGFKYSASTFYQITGNVLWGAKNQQILYGKFDGATSTSSGGWGINSLTFVTSNTDNANVSKAKLWYNTSNDFSTAILKDSIANPSGTITFAINGVSNLELNSVYFFLTYDVATVANCGNTLDAYLPPSAISVIGNIAGLKSVTTGTNPSGNRVISTTVLAPSVSISGSSSTVVSGGSVTFTPTPINGGTNPSYTWYVNGVLTATTSGVFTLTNITSTKSVYCIMSSNLPCVSPLTATSSTKTINIQGYKYSTSTFYQIVGNVAPGSKNNQVLYGKFTSATSSNSGGWGVSSLSFINTSFNTANVAKAKIWYNTVNDFSTAILKDSVLNPSGTITFSIPGVSNLGNAIVYFFLTYDMASSGVCSSNIVDASVASNGITIIGNIAGQKSVTSGSNPVGYLTVSTATTPASVSIAASSTSVVSGSAVTFTPTPVNGGTNPTFYWYVNGVLTATNTGAFTLSNITAQTTVYCKMKSNLACSSTQVSSASITVNLSFAGFQYSSSTFYQLTGAVIPGAKNQAIIYGKLKGAVSSNSGNWGVSELAFSMANTSNSNVIAAKLFYNTVNDFSTAVLKDSIANPFGIIRFNLSDITNLDTQAVYFFLAYDIAASGPCNGNILDAMVPANGITISGNIAGPKSVTTDPNPAGNKTITATSIVPSVTIVENTNNVVPGSTVIITPTPVNGGTNPSYAWYVNGLYTVSTTGPYSLNLNAQASVYCVMTSDLLCAVPQTIASSAINIIVKGYEYSSTAVYQVSGSLVPGAKNEQVVYAKLKGSPSNLPNGWGVTSLVFTMVNSTNSDVSKAKLWYNTSNDFSTAELKDSIINPSGNLVFTIPGVSNLDTSAVYFFLTYDIAQNGVCNGNSLDALLAVSGITSSGNGSGQHSASFDPDPSGNRIVVADILMPSVSISCNKSKVTSGSSAVFTPVSQNGGVNPTYDWYVNSVLTATTSGAFTLTNITAPVSVYCVVNSSLNCVSVPTANSNSSSVTITSAKYFQSKFYQISGTLTPGAKNQQILWGQFDGTTTSNTGGWGVSQIKFNMANSNNAAVSAAKLYFNTVNDFSTAQLKDSIANPSGTITFNVSGVSNLDLDSYFFFLAYDISPAICVGNTFDASIPTSAITVIGNVAGLKTPVSGTNPSGNRSFSGTPLVPSVTLTTSGTSTCVGSPVVFTPNPINGGLNPSYQWFVNNVSAGFTNGDFVASNLTNQAKVYCVMTSNLACASPLTATSSTKTITVSAYTNSVTISGPLVVYEGTTATFTASILNGGSTPSYQWYKNGIAIQGATKSSMYTDFAVSGDKITCAVTTSKSCTTPLTAVSNELTITTMQKGRSAAILDFSSRNGETYANNLYSAEHIMQVAGIPYIVSSNLEVVQNYPIVLCTSWLDSVAFTAFEDSIISNYVRNGGVIILPRMKNNDIKFVFGVDGYFNSSNRYSMSWNMGSNDQSLRWLEDTLEQKISLGRNVGNAPVIETRSYTLTSASPLAFYDDGTVAITKNNYGRGNAYAVGMSLKDLVMRPQLNLDYNAQRTFSNGFEPSTDVFIFWIKALYAQYVPNAVWKHTSPGSSKATIMMTHDIDAATSCLLMPSVADFEDSLGIKATYYITTHYIHDFVAGDFWTPFTAQRQYLLSKNQVIASHSVGHFPDMDIESIVAVGAIGNTVTNYLPHYNGNFTVGASVYGEVEVSKNLLDVELGVNVISYRPGYLYQHNQQINAMTDLGYKYSSSMSGNDVLTGFPYFAHKDMAFEGALTNILEIPLSISDAQVSDKVDSANYPRHVANWLKVVNKNTSNGAPTNLLIHPTRDFKVWAERSFISQLPVGLTFRDVDAFGDYWKMRNQVNYTSSIDQNNQMTIVIPSAHLPLSPDFSLVIDNGQNLAGISVKDENGNTILVQSENWMNNGKIIYGEELNGNNQRKAYVTGKAIDKKQSKSKETEIYSRCYPNPFSQSTNIVYLLNQNSKVKLDIYTVFGERISSLVDTEELAGIHQVVFDASHLSAGVYYYELNIDGKTKMEKIVITE